MGIVKSISRTLTDEKTEKALSACDRYRIVSDESGHDYAIKVYDTNNFYFWARAGEDDYDGPEYDGPDFEDQRLDGGVLTFTDPKVG